MGRSALAGPATTSGGASPAAALGREEFRDLERWLASESAQRLGLLGVEREIECRGQELLRLQLQGAYRRAWDGRRGGGFTCDGSRWSLPALHP